MTSKRSPTDRSAAAGRPSTHDADQTHYADLGARLRSMALDLAGLLAFALLSGVLLGVGLALLMGDPDPAQVTLGALAIALLLPPLYYLLPAWRRGWTPGLRVCRLRLARPDGAPPRLLQLAWRQVAGLLPPFLAMSALDAIWLDAPAEATLAAGLLGVAAMFLPVALTARRQALHDWAAGIVVMAR
jgi:uncharacterized RDD family membrane protein YckC